MQGNELAINLSEIILFRTFQGMPLEQCEYKELMDFFNELWIHIMELAARAMETIAQMIKNLAEDLHGSLQ